MRKYLCLLIFLPFCVSCATPISLCTGPLFKLNQNHRDEGVAVDTSTAPVRPAPPPAPAPVQAPVKEPVKEVVRAPEVVAPAPAPAPVATPVAPASKTASVAPVHAVKSAPAVVAPAVKVQPAPVAKPAPVVVASATSAPVVQTPVVKAPPPAPAPVAPVATPAAPVAKSAPVTPAVVASTPLVLPPEKAEAVSSAQVARVKLYFPSEKFVKDGDCPKVIYVEREVLMVPTIGSSAIIELLKGPTESEKERGFRTAIAAGNSLKDLTINGDFAQATFAADLTATNEPCAKATMRHQIMSTLMQFPKVKRVGIVSGNNAW